MIDRTRGATVVNPGSLKNGEFATMKLARNKNLGKWYVQEVNKKFAECKEQTKGALFGYCES